MNPHPEEYLMDLRLVVMALFSHGGVDRRTTIPDESST